MQCHSDYTPAGAPRLRAHRCPHFAPPSSPGRNILELTGHADTASVHAVPSDTPHSVSQLSNRNHARNAGAGDKVLAAASPRPRNHVDFPNYAGTKDLVVNAVGVRVPPFAHTQVIVIAELKPTRGSSPSRLFLFGDSFPGDCLPI